MKAKDYLALVGASGVRLVAKILGRGATSLPGELALKISPDLPTRLLKDEDVLLVSGTNGKTSTVNFLHHMLEGLGYEVVANLAGANLIYGITASLLKHRKKKSSKPRIYLFEIDEAHLAKYGKLLSPKEILLTNLFPDQEDRYGSVQDLRDMLRHGLREMKHFDLFLPADDPGLRLLAFDREENTHFFGEHNEDLFLHFKESIQDAATPLPETKESCPCCGNPLYYAWHSFGNHGGFYCPGCDYSWLLGDLSYSFTKDGATLYYAPTGESGELKLPVPGRHNLINAAGVLLPLLKKGHTLNELLPLFKTLKAPFGRMETIESEGKKMLMVLQKNPVGMESALTEAGRDEKLKNLFIMVNKRENDGRDASWLEKVDYASLIPQTILEDAKNRLFITGEAATTLCRVLDSEQIPYTYLDDWNELFTRAYDATKPGEALWLLPNYSAMMELRGNLKKRFNLKDFWQ